MGTDVVRMVAISTAPLEVTAVQDLVRERSAGAVAIFVGVVRDNDGGKGVTQLAYSAHPTALAVMRQVVADVVAAQPVDGVDAVAAVHRVGDLVVGEPAIVVAVAAGHRGEAFAVCESLVDEIKARVPIWKHQIFADGTDEWVGTPG